MPRLPPYDAPALSAPAAMRPVLQDQTVQGSSIRDILPVRMMMLGEFRLFETPQLVIWLPLVDIRKDASETDHIVTMA